MDKVQMRGLVRAETMDGPLSPRQVFWTTPERARHYVDNRIAELIAPPAGPKETPEVVITEAKKYSPAVTGGPSIGSAQSAESGKDAQSSASPQAQASATITSKPYTLSLPKRK